MKFDAPPSEPLSESPISESRQTRVPTSCGLDGCVCLRVQVLGEIMLGNSLEQTVIGGAEPRRLTPIVYPGRHRDSWRGAQRMGPHT